MDESKKPLSELAEQLLSSIRTALEIAERAGLTWHYVKTHVNGTNRRVPSGRIFTVTVDMALPSSDWPASAKETINYATLANEVWPGMVLDVGKK